MNGEEQELNGEQKAAIKELALLHNIDYKEAFQLLKKYNWNVEESSRRLDLEQNSHPGTSRDEKESSSSRAATPRHVPGYAFTLPSFSGLSTEFRSFLEKDLIETSTQRRLENSKHLNWWHPFGQKLYPLSTTGDGNCLLHAASLGMWGLHDRQLTLRDSLYEMLVKGSRKSCLWRRWKWAEHNAIHSSELALTLSDEEWQQEWDGLITLASPVPRKQDETASNSSDQIYESLETIHVFALAHVIKRPIVVVSDTVLRNAKGEELSPVCFGGVYLPLECDPEQCHRSPLVLCYDSAHFSPLVPMHNDGNLKQLIPIQDCNRNLLPVHFATDPGPEFNWWKNRDDGKIAEKLTLSDADKIELMSRYMDVVRLDLRRGSSVRSVRRVRSAHAGLHSLARPLPTSTSSSSPSTSSSISNGEHELTLARKKGLTLATTGVTASGKHHEKWRVLNDIASGLLRSFRLSSHPKGKEKSVSAQECINFMHKPSCVVAAELSPLHHEYMEVMVKQYMKTAKLRFQQTGQKPNGTPDGRKRISRSFSASSLMITCINSPCNQPASQATNFLCDECFAQQKAFLMSFSLATENGGVTSSSTLPSFIPNRTSDEFDKDHLPFIEEKETWTATPSPVSATPMGPPEQPFNDCSETPRVKMIEKDGLRKIRCVEIIAEDSGVVHYVVPEEVI